jgi:membrane protease YdiL (CAAX protease family)
MNNYLKYKPGWMQLLIFGSLTFGVYLISSFMAVLILTQYYNIPITQLREMNLSDPALLSALKVLQTILSIMLFFIPSVIFAYLSDPKPLQYIGFKNPVPKSFFLIAVVILLASFPMVAWLSDVNQNMHLPKSMEHFEKIIRDSETKNNKMIQSFLKMKSLRDLFMMLIVIGIIPAITEEVFFRGVLQRLFILLTKRPWAGIIFTAVLFSVLHGFLGFFPRLALGIILGALYWYSGSLWPGLLVHFLNNALQVVLIYYNPQFVEKDPNFSVLLITASTFLIIALTWWMGRISQTRFAEVYDTDDFHIGPRDQYIA